MRHTFATYFYNNTKDISLVARKLGLKETKNVDKYIHIARDLEEQTKSKRDLFYQVLRSIKARGKAEKIDCWQKRHQSNKFTPRNTSGPAEI